MRGEIIGFFIIKQIKKPRLCSVLQDWYRIGSNTPNTSDLITIVTEYINKRRVWGVKLYFRDVKVSLLNSF